MTRRERAVCLWVVAVLWSATTPGVEPRARAQTALATVMVQSESSLCLAAARPGLNQLSGGPALGWRIVVEPCAGTRAQRFGQVFGDYDDFVHDSGHCLAQVPGTDLVELAPCHTERLVLESSGHGIDGTPVELRLGRGELCLTAPPAGSTSRGVTLTPCGSRPGQRWTMSHAR